MENWNGTALKREAKKRLRATGILKLSALHAGVTLGIALLLTVLQYVLSEGIDQTGGLSGMGLRSILQTGQVLLQWANTLLIPFWNLGFLFAALCWWREQTVRPKDLLTGFRRFGPYLRLLLLKAVGLFVLLLVCAYASSILYMLTPASSYFVELINTMNMDAAAMEAFLLEMSEAQLMQIMENLRPMLVIWAIVSVALTVPLFYRIRLAEYVLLDRPGTGAIAATLMSFRMTRRNCGKLLGLDLRFWWYYLLQTVCVCLLYGDMILEMVGVEMAGDETVLFFASYLLYLAANFLLMTLCRPRVETAYAAAYDVLKAGAYLEKKKPAEAKKLPWDQE